MSRYSKVLVLGHSGFIGGHLVKSLSAAMPNAEIEGLSYPSFDMAEAGAADEIARRIAPGTAVVMLSCIKRQFGDDLATFQKNLAMVIQLAKAMEKSSPAAVLYFSSAAVYGEDIHNLAITEDSAVCPTSFYGMAKFTAERVLGKAASGLPDTRLVVIRPPTIYGPGDKGGTYGPVAFLNAVLSGETITLWGDGTELRDFVHVSNIAAVVLNLLAGDFEGVLNVATGKSCSFRDMIDIIGGLCDREPDIRSKPRSKEKVDNVFDVAKLRNVLPDIRFMDMEEGIRRVMDSMTGEP